jgi:hypothetical protein
VCVPRAHVLDRFDVQNATRDVAPHVRDELPFSIQHSAFVIEH